MEKAARGAQPEEEERTDGELNWVQRARLASEVAAQKHRVGGKQATPRGGQAGRTYVVAHLTRASKIGGGGGRRPWGL